MTPWVSFHSPRPLAVRLPLSAALRIGTNAVYRLASAPVVVRIARGAHLLASAEKGVAVAAWLRDEKLPADRVLPRVPQPIVVAEHPVTFWGSIERGSQDPTYGDLGRRLRRLHALTPPDDVPLPAHDMFARTGRRIRIAQGIAEDVRQFLLDREAELRERLADVAFPSQPLALHGDAHVDNLMRTPSGEVILIGFENFARGHREWDLVVAGQEYESAGWIDDRQYGEFDVQEFKMTTWLMQNNTEGPEAAEEFARRPASIRDGSTRRTWCLF